MFEPDPPSGDFEAGTVGVWLPAGCTLEPNSAGVPHSGSWSMKMTSTGGFGRTIACSTPQGGPGFNLPISPGRYRVGGWARSASIEVDHFDFQLTWHDSTGTEVGHHYFPRAQAVLDSYVELGRQVVVTPPGTASFVLLGFASTAIGGPDMPAGQVVDWDDFYWEAVATGSGILAGVAFGA